MDKTIIFLNEAMTEGEQFSDFSNFLRKFYKMEELVGDDVKRIKSKLITLKNITKKTSVIYEIDKNRSKFLTINKPERIYENIRDYQIVFAIIIDVRKLYDISDLSMLVLIRKYFIKYNVLVLLQGGESDYYKISHFFIGFSKIDTEIYDSFFFIGADHKVKHLINKEIGALGKFLPLQYVDEQLLHKLEDRVSNYIPGNWMLDTLRAGKTDWSVLRDDDILFGTMKMIYNSRTYFQVHEIEDIVICLQSMNILTWVFFAYIFKEYKKMTMNNCITVRMLYAFINQLSLYSNGCLQLMENIVFHSQMQEGIFSFRICDSKSRKLKQKYQNYTVSRNTAYIEIIIADYCADNVGGNIVQNFADKIQNIKLKTIFRNITPYEFLSCEEDKKEGTGITNAWNQYYEKSDNIGKHFGLKIFARMVKESQGTFLFESHESHEAHQGEANKKELDSENIKCLPGTQYVVLLPIAKLQEQLSQVDIGIDSNVDMEEQLQAHIEYRIVENKIVLEKQEYSTQEKKEECIRYMVQKLTEYIDKEKYDICFISAEKYRDNIGELLCKAILMAAFKLPSVAHLAIFNCNSEFVNSFVGCMMIAFRDTQIDYALEKKEFQIALFTEKTFDEVVLIPGNYECTVAVNEQLFFSRGVASNWFHLSGINKNLGMVEKKMVSIIPFEVLFMVNCNGIEQTIFEHYTKSIIEKDIQQQAFGCKIEHTHMRLGSTIHVNLFYEAELLFGNKMFVSRFAYMIISELHSKVNGVEKLTIYGYATYSELLIFEIKSIIKKIYSNIDVDYAILEREVDNRGDSHIDRIRYTKEINSREERLEYFQNRKIVCIIPVSSTLKTVEKMVNLFCEENGEACRNNIIENYALILVGSRGENKYWSLTQDRRIFSRMPVTDKNISPKYYIDVQLDYEEALTCRNCYPENTLLEQPLIEVNAASTIPNQEFGLYTQGNRDKEIRWIDIEEEEKYIEPLKESLIYSHVMRGANHFLMYFQTDKLITAQRDAIVEWLCGIERSIPKEKNDFHVIFCPNHFSNAGFLEYVNRIVFHNAAVIIRDDIDKEYRGNIVAKYSNLQLLIRKMSEEVDAVRTIKFYFIDDCLITGRSFWRAKSLVESVVSLYSQSDRIKLHIFEKIFVLIDRNSFYNRMQYVRCWDSASRCEESAKTDFFAFRSVNISSIRTHGDSCIICNLEKQATILSNTSSTRSMEEYWKKEEVKFRVETLKEYLEKERADGANEESNDEELRDKRDRGYRRLVCTHIAKAFINDKMHGNHSEKALELILKLLITDFEGRTKDQMEYFLSYLKVLSRPFLVFNKAQKEAIFDILLIQIEYLIHNKSIISVIENMQRDKEYLQDETLRNLFIEFEAVILTKIQSIKDKKDYFAVLMKQLIELKGNYLIRLANMNQMVKFINGLGANDLYINYLHLVKQLVGISSDTSKSVWLDYALHNQKEIGRDKTILNELPDSIREQMYIENSRVYDDAIRKLNALLDICQEEREILHSGDNLKKILSNEGRRKIFEASGEKICDLLTEYQFGNFKELLIDYGHLDSEKRKLAATGSIGILSSVELLRYIEEQFGESKSQEKHGDVLEKYNIFANLLNKILQGKYVKVIMEMTAEYDVWKSDIMERFNGVMEKKEKGCENLGKFNVNPIKEYILLADTTAKSGGMQEIDVVVNKQLDKYAFSKKKDSPGYQLDREEKCFIWEMKGEQKYPIYIYAVFEEDIMKPEEYWNCLNNVRNTMMHYRFLNSKVFSFSTSNQLQEIMTNSRELQISKRAKALSHTSNEVQMKQYEHVCKGKEVQYRSDVLTLLSDLCVSEIYRRSLNVEYYIPPCKTKSVKWNDKDSIWNKQIDFYVEDGSNSKPKRICVENAKIFDNDEVISGDDEILCYNVANGGRETFLLLHSLILNAGGENRGKVEEDSVQVYVSKTKDRMIRIANQIDEDKSLPDIKAIQEELHNPPSSKEKGISMWSMSRYIKSMIYSILFFEIRVLDEQEICRKEHLLKCRSRIEDFLSQDYEIRIRIEEKKEKKYFSVEVPLLSEKYR